MPTTTLVLQLKKGVQPAQARLDYDRKRREIEVVVIKNDADENVSGWSEDE